MQSLQERRTKAWVLGLAAAASFMVALDTLVVSTALNAIRTTLGASVEALAWTVNAYNLTFAMLLLCGAALGDRFGRRRVFAIGLAAFTAASVACGLAGTPSWLIAARAVQGAGAAMVIPLAMALLSAAFPREERPRALGFFSSVTGLALICGPLVGGMVVQNVDWHWIFWLNVPVGLIVIPLALRYLPESRGEAAPLDLPGLALGTAATLGLVWGLVRGNEVGWSSPETMVPLACGVACAVGFILRERHTAHPLVPLQMFRAAAFSSAIAACFLFSASLYGTLFFVAQFFQTAQGYSPMQAGLRLLPWTATLFVVAPIAGALVTRVGERWLIVVGLTLQAVGLAWVALITTPTVTFAELLAPLVISGAGISMAMPAAQNAVVSAVAPTQLGKASGTYNTFRFLGGVFGIAVSVVVFSLSGGYGTPELFNAGFAPALAVAALLAFGGAIAGVWQPGRRAASIAPAGAAA